MGDPACDGALREVFASPTASVGKDLLQAVRAHAATTSHEEAPATHAFMDDVLSRPPPGLAVSEEEAGLARQLFIDDSIQIVQAMLYFSLAGGLARFVLICLGPLYLISELTGELEHLQFPYCADVGSGLVPCTAPQEVRRRGFAFTCRCCLADSERIE